MATDILERLLFSTDQDRSDAYMEIRQLREEVERLTKGIEKAAKHLACGTRASVEVGEDIETLIKPKAVPE